MQVTVRLFAALRQHAGTGSLALELPEGATVADALGALGDRLPAGAERALVCAVNREYAAVTHVLGGGDELALIPPVSGGAGAEAVRRARVTGDALDPGELERLVRDPAAGATVVFTGITREVSQLDYEAYAEMAEPLLARIAAEAVSRHGLCAAAVEHRVGVVPLSEPSVVVAASAPHRPEAFAGARELIDRIKAEAPIWKAEEGEWVQGALPPTP